MLNKLQSASRQKYLSPYLFATVHTSLRESEQACKWLERAYCERNPMLAFLRVDPLFDRLRSAATYNDLLDRMNFPVFVA